MAYMNQEKKAKLAPEIKAVLKKFGMKGTIGVRNHSTLVVNIKEGKLDMIANYNETMQNKPHSLPTYWQPATTELTANFYWYHEHFSGECKQFLKELFTAMNGDNHNRSDITTDYFDVGWYVDVHIGQWNKPYLVV